MGHVPHTATLHPPPICRALVRVLLLNCPAVFC